MSNGHYTQNYSRPLVHPVQGTWPFVNTVTQGQGFVSQYVGVGQHILPVSWPEASMGYTGGNQYIHGVESIGTGSNYGYSDRTAPDTTPHDCARTPIQQVHDYRSLTNISEEALGPWLKEAAQNGKRVWECRNCGQHFVRRQHGYSHVLKQHLNQEKLFECRICKEQFNSENSARRHRDYQERRFSCNICCKVFARPDYCRLHQAKCSQARDLRALPG